VICFRATLSNCNPVATTVILDAVNQVFCPLSGLLGCLMKDEEMGKQVW
jgi:hypothetical protein